MKIVLKTLDELGIVRRGKSKNRPRDAMHLYDGPYPFIQTSDVKNAGLYITEFTQTYSAAGLAQSKLWKSGTLCITIAANIADTSILSFDACFPDSIIGFIPDPKKSEVRYIKYLFDAVLQQIFKKFTQGSAQDNLSQGKLLSLKLPVAEDVNDQNAIAEMLANYDDLIDTNRRRIQLLEEAARFLFREWFVYFRFPEHEKLKIVDGVPEGWKKENIFSIADVNYGKNLPTNKFIEGGEYPVYGAAKIIGYFNKYTKEKRTIIAGCRGSVGQVTIAKPKSYITNNSFTFEPKNLEIFYWLFFLLELRGFNDVISGTAQPQITLTSLSKVKLLLPDIKVIKDFELKVASYFSLIFTLEDQNQKLAQARDLLLPRLMSGAIEV